MKYLKLQKILNKTDITNEETLEAIREFEDKVKVLYERLQKEVQVPGLKELNSRLDTFRNDLNIGGLQEDIKKLEANFQKSIFSVGENIEKKQSDLEFLLENNKDELSENLKSQTIKLSQEILFLKRELNKIIELNKEELIRITGDINTLVDRIKILATSEEVKTITEKAQKDLEKITINVNEFKADFGTRLVEIGSKGGGGISRQIRVEGSILGKYNDINFYGVNSSIASSIDDTNKRINIGLLGGALSGFVPYTGATNDLNIGAYTIQGGTGSSLYILSSDSFRISNATGRMLYRGEDIVWNDLSVPTPDENILNGFSSTTANRTWTLPDASGIIALQGLAGTKIYYVADSSGGAVTRKLTFIDGILTSET